MAMRIHRQRTKGWRMPEGAVYVGRPSRWGNPYEVTSGRNRLLAVGQFRLWAARYLATHPRWLAPLRGHDLACWCNLCEAHADGRPLGVTCPLDLPCHVDVLLELANG
jgi:hypothetical protein